MAYSKKEYSKRFFYMQIYLMIFLSIAPMDRSSSILNEIKAKKKRLHYFNKNIQSFTYTNHLTWLRNPITASAVPAFAYSN